MSGYDTGNCFHESHFCSNMHFQVNLFYLASKLWNYKAAKFKVYSSDNYGNLTGSRDIFVCIFFQICDKFELPIFQK